LRLVRLSYAGAVRRDSSKGPGVFVGAPKEETLSAEERARNMEGSAAICCGCRSCR
jgi:hypothetical protein